MKNLKKLLAIMLSLALSCALLTSCNKDKDEGNKEETKQEEAKQEETKKEEKQEEVKTDDSQAVADAFMEAYKNLDADKMGELCDDPSGVGIDEFESMMGEYQEAMEAMMERMEYEVTEKEEEDGKIKYTYTVKVPEAPEPDPKAIKEAELEEEEFSVTVEEIDGEWKVVDIDG